MPPSIRQTLVSILLSVATRQAVVVILAGARAPLSTATRLAVIVVPAGAGAPPSMATRQAVVMVLFLAFRSIEKKVS
jgi:putative Ca2+/H+ antiporter (TMEM165/GDT1 family)